MAVEAPEGVGGGVGMRQGESRGMSGLELKVLIVAIVVFGCFLNFSNLFSEHRSLSCSFSFFSIPLKVFNTVDMFASGKARNFLCYSSANCGAFCCFSCYAIDSAR